MGCPRCLEACARVLRVPLLPTRAVVEVQLLGGRWAVLAEMVATAGWLAKINIRHAPLKVLFLWICE